MFLRGIFITTIKIKYPNLCDYHRIQSKCTFRTVLNTYSGAFCENSKFSIWPANNFKEEGDYYQKSKVLQKILKKSYFLKL